MNKQVASNNKPNGTKGAPPPVAVAAKPAAAPAPAKKPRKKPEPRSLRKMALASVNAFERATNGLVRSLSGHVDAAALRAEVIRLRGLASAISADAVKERAPRERVSFAAGTEVVLNYLGEKILPSRAGQVFRVAGYQGEFVMLSKDGKEISLPSNCVKLQKL